MALRGLSSALLAATALFLSPSVASAQGLPPPVIASAMDDGGGLTGELRAFYAARGYRPLWIGPTGPRPAVEDLLRLARTASLDKVKASKVKARDLERALQRLSEGRNPESLLRVELAASRTLATYVGQMRKAARASMIYESPALQPTQPTARYILSAAAEAPSIDEYVRTMGWMHPFYAPIRSALADPGLPVSTRLVIEHNLDRLRAIPALPAKRYVLVDAAGARLWMFENGKPAGSMRVVVGKPEMQTPAMAGFIRYAQVNPYWNIPPDLVQQRIAANVLDKGIGYFRSSGYQALSDWSDDAKVIDPAGVDWRAVAEGRQEVRVRQLPGGDNFMGKVKFMFPNAQGIYLHDTPDKGLMKHDLRHFSSGCVRLENADRLGRWLLGRPLPTKARKPEQRVDLPVPVPVYITYLTAAPGIDGSLAFTPDVYGRDDPARSGKLAIAK